MEDGLLLNIDAAPSLPIAARLPYYASKHKGGKHRKQQRHKPQRHSSSQHPSGQQHNQQRHGTNAANSTIATQQQRTQQMSAVKHSQVDTGSVSLKGYSLASPVLEHESANPNKRPKLHPGSSPHTANARVVDGLNSDEEKEGCSSTGSHGCS
eukprot:jgi/Chrzof1/14345/UNPLg00619.t1